MSDITTKPWWKSKQIWVGIVAVFIAAYNTASSAFGIPAIPEFIYGILGAMGIYNRVASDGFKTAIK